MRDVDTGVARRLTGPAGSAGFASDVQRYLDDEAGLSFADAFTFKSAEDRASFEFDYVDAAKPAYEFRSTVVFTNGMSKATEWQKTDKDDLTVPVN